MDINNRLPSRLIIVAGTYDGVLAGWDTSSEHIQEEENDIQKKKHYDIDLKLLRRKNDGKYLKLSFAMSAHEGSVRCLDVSGGGISSSSSSSNQHDKKMKKRQRSDSVDSSTQQQQEEDAPLPGSLLSGGYDETINVFNLQKHNQVGELKTPSDLGSPLCCAFAPPSNSNSTTTTTGVTTTTHALVGLTSGKIILYKKKDMSVQHILSGHDTHGVQCIAVHPTGKMALSGGRSDGKIILWDLMKGRLAFVIKLPKIKVVAAGRGGKGGGGQLQTVNHIVWSDDGSRYAYCYGNKITARDVASSAGGNGEDGAGADDYLLDVEMPSRVNQLAFIGGPEGIFLCAACDDGGLPVLEVGQLLLDEDEDGEGDNAAQNERRAIMAIEPVDDIVAGDDRFKCIKSVEGGSGFLVVTANSGGIVSLMDLEGAARMMLTPPSSEGMGGSGSDSDDDESKDDSDEDEDDDIEAAVEILDSVRIGSGARITDLAVWSYDNGVSEEVNDDTDDDEGDLDMPQENKSEEDDEEVSVEEDEVPTKKKPFKKKEHDNREKIDMDPEAVDKARKLVVQAKKHQKKKKKKKQKQ